jgi:hypothetical protein
LNEHHVIEKFVENFKRMKLSLLFILFCLVQFGIQAQPRLIGTSTYNHDGSNYTLSDTSVQLHFSGNMAYAQQDTSFASVLSKPDSLAQYTLNLGNLILSSTTRQWYDPSYHHQTRTISTGYANNLKFVESDIQYYYTGNRLDSSNSLFTNFQTVQTYHDYITFYHYDALNQMDTAWVIYRNASGFSSSYRYEYTYYPNNLLQTITVHTSSDSVNYTPDNQQTYYYNSQDLNDSIVYSSWFSNTWYTAAKNVFTYNSNKQQIQKDYLGFDNTTQLYSPSARDVYLRTNGIFRDTLYGMLWSSGLNVFDTTVKMGYQYQAGLLTRSNGYTRNTTTGQWQPNPYGAIHNFYYDMMPNRVEETALNALAIFPNPVENILNIHGDWSGANYVIYSMNGAPVLSGKLNAQQRIQVQSIPGGMYFVALELDKKMIRTSFLKQTN